MLGIEEARHVEVGADILDHDVGRVAPAADGDVAVGQGEAFERGGVCALRRLRRWFESEWSSADVSIALARARSARSVSARRCWPAGRTVGELGAKRAHVRPCRCQATSRLPATGAAGSRRSNRGLPRPQHRRRRGSSRRGEVAGCSTEGTRACGNQRKRGASGQGCDRLAAAQEHFGQITLRQLGGSWRSGSTRRQLPSTPVMRTRSPGATGAPSSAPLAVADADAAAMLVDRLR